MEYVFQGRDGFDHTRPCFLNEKTGDRFLLVAGKYGLK